MSGAPGCDVVVVGEALVELSSEVPLAEADQFTRSYSGDALNAAAAAAAAGAHVALITRVGDDEFGDSLCEYASKLNVDMSAVVRSKDPNGIYFTSMDPRGERHFVYHRKGSAAAGLSPQDLNLKLLAETKVLLVSGVGCAISTSSAAAVYKAAKVVADSGGRVIYDPNYRPRLGFVGQARHHLRDLCSIGHVVTPSSPHDTDALLETSDPDTAARVCRDLGADIAIVTLGSEGVLVHDGAEPARLPAIPPRRVVDATGCGDALSGALAAGLAAGRPVALAANGALAMASRCLAHRGGTSYLTAQTNAADEGGGYA